MDRRTFTLGLTASLAAPLPALSQTSAAKTGTYRGPNVILVRFGGGVRRAETINEAATWAPTCATPSPRAAPSSPTCASKSWRG